jgi:hypothetical protein
VLADVERVLGGQLAELLAAELAWPRDERFDLSTPCQRA